MRSRAASLLLALAFAAALRAQQHPRDREIHDPDTLAWWHTTEALSGDSMEGRDTGSPAYQRAAEYVAARFKQAGLQPAGDHASFFQAVQMHEVAVDPAGTSFALLRASAAELPFSFLNQITLVPAANLPLETEAPLTFRGFCGADAMKDIAGKIVVCFGTQRRGLPSAAERLAAARAGKAVGLINVDDPYFTLEPPRWPAAYARTVALGPPPAAPAARDGLLSMRLSADSFPALLEGTGKDAAALLAAGGHQQPLPSFDLPAKLRVRLHLTERSYSSPNVLAILPGSDPDLAAQYLVLSAHLDGYGYGTPVLGDNLYNGALDDAAYVALLIQFADDLKQQHRTPRRSILFCAFTGEEKGLLGANFFVEHPTVPAAQLAADINLDQLRPLFPLRLLTALAIDDTTLGATARQVGASLGIQLRPDPEPERGLLRRADHFPFLRSGVPAIGFIFGYEPGTDAEKRYREWYQVRYHRPQDDLTQPMDFDAAAKFDQFFYKLVETVADAPQRPSFLIGSHQAAQSSPSPRPDQSSPDHNRNHADAQLDLGVEAFKMGRYADAQSVFQSALKEDPSSTQAQLHLAPTYAAHVIPGLSTPDNIEIADKARKAFNQVLEREPAHLLALRQIASLDRNVGDLDQARHDERRVLDVAPNDAEAWFTLGVVNWRQAYENANRMLKNEGLSDNGVGNVKLSAANCSTLIAQNLPLVTEGLQTLQKAVEINPTYNEAMSYLSLTERRKADLECGNEAAIHIDLAQSDLWAQRSMAARRQTEQTRLQQAKP